MEILCLRGRRVRRVWSALWSQDPELWTCVSLLAGMRLQHHKGPRGLIRRCERLGWNWQTDRPADKQSTPYTSWYRDCSGLRVLPKPKNIRGLSTNILTKNIWCFVGLWLHFLRTSSPCGVAAASVVLLISPLGPWLIKIWHSNCCGPQMLHLIFPLIILQWEGENIKQQKYDFLF